MNFDLPNLTGRDPNSEQPKSQPIKDVNGMFEAIWLGISINNPGIRFLCGACGTCVRRLRPMSWSRLNTTTAVARVGLIEIQIPIVPKNNQIPVPDKFLNVYTQTCDECLKGPPRKCTPPPSCARCGIPTSATFCENCCKTCVGDMVFDGNTKCDKCEKDTSVCLCYNHTFDPIGMYFN